MFTLSVDLLVTILQLSTIVSRKCLHFYSPIQSHALGAGSLIAHAVSALIYWLLLPGHPRFLNSGAKPGAASAMMTPPLPFPLALTAHIRPEAKALVPLLSCKETTSFACTNSWSQCIHLTMRNDCSPQCYCICHGLSHGPHHFFIDNQAAIKSILQVQAHALFELS